MIDIILLVWGVVSLVLVVYVLHLFVSDYEDTMSEIRKLDNDDEVLLGWLGDSDDQ